MDGFEEALAAYVNGQKPPTAWDGYIRDYMLTPDSMTKPDATYVEARMMPIPTTLQRKLYERALRIVPWEKIRDEVTIPAMQEIEKGVEEMKDSANAYMYKATNPSDAFIDETVSNHLRKFGKQ